MILIKINKNIRIEINCDNINYLLSTISTAGIAKTLAIANFLVKYKNFV